MAGMRLTFSLLILAAVGLQAQAPTIEQSMSMKMLAGAVISPDAKYVAYGVAETNWEENAYVTQLWLANVATGERLQLTAGKKGASGPQWSPDGKRLAFVADRDGKRQVYAISPAGGEAVKLTSHETGVGAFEWSPDGKWIAFTASEPESKEMKERKQKYGDFELVQQDYVHQHLWVQRGEGGGKAEQMTKGREYTVQGFEWSPDGKEIAFSGPRVPDLSYSDTADIYVARVSDKLVRKIVSTAGPDTNPHWSPDGRQIAFRTAGGREYSYHLNAWIGVVSAEGGAVKYVTQKFDENANPVLWAKDGIYFSALQKTESAMFRLNPETLAYERVTPKDWMMSGVSFDATEKTMAFTASRPNEFMEVYVSPVAGFAPKKLTAMADQYKEFKLARREVIEWKSTDGTVIEGVLIKPVDFDPQRKYPLLVVIHGGPTGIDTPVLSADRYYPIERFVAKGALVLRPNYRGSAGYGERFRQLNVRNLGVGDAWDVISGVDHLIAKGWVDGTRVGSMGWSQGGYISAFLTTSSDRFKAISVGAGISDWMTYYVNTDIHPFTRQYLKATPWDDPEIYRKTSPISYIKTAKTPTLIQHGDGDKRVPLPNAYELYQALQDKKVPVKLSVFKGFGHGIDKPKQQRAVLEQNYEWFSQWIWGEAPAAGESMVLGK